MTATTSPAIDLRHLRYFLAVAEELHFGRAAERLYIAQPPLSQAIRTLETELGVQLFHRTSRQVVATEAGLVLAEQVRKVLAAFDVAVAEARHAGGGYAVVRIGCSPFLPPHRLQTVLRAIEQRDPRFCMQVTHLTPREQRRRLMTRDLDVGIAQMPPSPGFVTEAIFAGEPMAAFLPPDHRLTRREAIRPEDVADEAQIVYPQGENATIMDRFYGPVADAGFRFRENREAPGLSERDLLFAVAEGRGILLATYSLTDVTEAGRLVERRPLDPPLAMPETVLVWRENQPPHLDRILSTLISVARDLRAYEGEASPAQGEQAGHA